MRICQIATGMIPILEKGKMGWGAVEKITREYKESLEKLGHEVDIKFVNEIDANHSYDFVHVHMGNLALELERKGVQYVFSLHDHHTEHYGKDSFCFKHNLDAMKGSIFSICHAEYLVDYFDATDKLFYLPHGVNTGFFATKSNEFNGHKLLMVANNGLAGDYGYDRKGFRYGVEAARELDLPITIVGTDANMKFFDIHKDLMAYDKLDLRCYNPTEQELVGIYHEHTIFLHPSMLEAGHPNLTLMEAASCGLPIVGTYRGTKEIVGMHTIIEISTPQVLNGIKEVISQYDIVVPFMAQVREQYDWINVCKQLEKNYYAVSQFQNFDSKTIREKYNNVYNNTEKL